MVGQSGCHSKQVRLDLALRGNELASSWASAAVLWQHNAGIVDGTFNVGAPL